MWQRFTQRARNVVFYAQEEAQRFGEDYVGTECFLLGLLRESDSTAVKVFAVLGVSLTRIRSEIEAQIPKRESRSPREMTLTPRAKRVVDFAYEEATNLNNNYIGTEHLLLGLIRETDSLAGRVLAKVGIELGRVQREVYRIQQGEDTDAQESAVGVAQVGNEYKLVRLSNDSVFVLADSSEYRNGLWIAAKSFVQESQTAIEEYEELLNNAKTCEADFQKFFERNPEFLINDDYKAIHPHVMLKRQDSECLIPDFLVEPIGRSGFCDIVELKLPNKDLVRRSGSSQRRVRFSSQVHDAISQLHEYHSYFEEERHREFVEATYNLKVFKPKLILVFGREHSAKQEEIRKSEAQVAGVQIYTFDDLLARARMRLERFK